MGQVESGIWLNYLPGVQKPTQKKLSTQVGISLGAVPGRLLTEKLVLRKALGCSQIFKEFLSYRRCKEPAELNGQIDFPQLTLCLLASFTPLLPMSLNHCPTVLSPQTVWIHSPHAIFIPLLSLTLNFLSQPLGICYHSLCSIWYLRAHFLHHLVAEPILYWVKHTDSTHKRVFHSYFSKIRASRRVSLFLPPSGFLKHLLVLTYTWHLFIQLSFHRPFILQIFPEQVHQAWHSNYTPCFNHNIALWHISDFLL